MAGGSNIAHLEPADMARWPKPDYENPDRKTWLEAYSMVWFIASTLILGLRYMLRFRGRAAGLGLDDAVLLPGWLCGVMFTIIIIMFTQWAQGDRHIWDTEPDRHVDQVFCIWLSEFTFLACGCFIKVSVLLFYRRLVADTYSRRYKWLIWSAIGFTTAYTVVFCICLLINCSPTAAYWRAFDAEYASSVDYVCWDTTVINKLAGICAILSDVFAVVLPCALTWNLAITKRQKIALHAVFCLGFLVVAASCVRTYWLTALGTTKDVTRAAFHVFVWAQLELQGGILCASAPSLRILLRRYLGSGIDAKSDDHNNNDDNNTSDNDDTHSKKSLRVAEAIRVVRDKGAVVEVEGKSTLPNPPRANSEVSVTSWCPSQSQERLVGCAVGDDIAMSILAKGIATSGVRPERVFQK